jgi:hypothetical protein
LLGQKLLQASQLFIKAGVDALKLVVLVGNKTPLDGQTLLHFFDPKAHQQRGFAGAFS